MDQLWINDGSASDQRPICVVWLLYIDEVARVGF